jgi:hypothetical protein
VVIGKTSFLYHIQFMVRVSIIGVAIKINEIKDIFNPIVSIVVCN